MGPNGPHFPNPLKKSPGPVIRAMDSHSSMFKLYYYSVDCIFVNQNIDLSLQIWFIPLECKDYLECQLRTITPGLKGKGPGMRPTAAFHEGIDAA
jgi:hypothetical protein